MRIRRLALMGCVVFTILLMVLVNVQPVFAATSTFRPNASGDATALTPYGGGGITNYQACGDDSDSTNVYYPTSSGTNTWYDLYNLPNHTTEAGTISNVRVYSRGSTQDAGNTFGYAFKTHSTVYEDCTFNNTSVTSRYADYATNPFTSSAWTWSEIDALQIGAEITYADDNYEVDVYDVWIVVTYTLTAPNITISAATSVNSTTATLNGNITATGGENPTVTVYWGTTDGGQTPANWQHSASPTSPAQPQGVAAFSYNATSLPTGTTIYFSAKGTNSYGTGWPAASLSFLTKPAAPTNVAATDGTFGDKVVVTWDKSTGATAYKVYRDAGLVATLGDVATYNDTGAGAPTVTAGTATASDGASTLTLAITGMSITSGATSTYYVIANNATGDSSASSTDTGYTHGSLDYQWYRSAADSDAAYSLLTGATTNPYVDTTAPAGGVAAVTQVFGGFGRDWAVLKGNVGNGGSGDGRYYYCAVSADGVGSQDTNHNRGYRGGGNVTQIGFDYGLTTGYGSSTTATQAMVSGEPFALTVHSLTPATNYHYRAKVYDGSWQYGNDFCVATTGSPVIYEYFNTGGNGDSQHIYGANYVAEQFTCQSTSHTVFKIVVWIKCVGSPADILVELYHADNSNNPTGLALASCDISPVTWWTSYLPVGFTVDEDSITAGQKYAVVVSAPTGDGSNYVLWQCNTAGGLADAVGLHSTDGGLNWTSDTPYDYLFEIWGNPCIKITSALAYTNYIESNDLLFMVEYTNTYPPYYNVTDPAQSFTVRLYAADGITLIASTPMVQWGNKPGSIYLNANQAASITKGGAYYLAIYGTFSGNPSAMYQLQPADWSGSIGGWVLATVHDMADYYNVTFTNFVPNRGELLNDEANAIFNAGIPYLMTMHPELFTMQIGSYPIATDIVPTSNVTDTWQGIVGSNVSTLFSALGLMIGLDGKYIGLALMLMMYVAYATSVAVKGGSALVALAIGFPIISLALSLGFLSFPIVGVIMFLAIILAAMGFFLTRT